MTVGEAPLADRQTPQAASTGSHTGQEAVGPIRRLSRYDLHCLAAETAARPLHIGILAMLDGRSLLEPSGRLRLADLRREIDQRVAAVPELRRVVYRPGLLAGRPLWVEDPAFRIDRHVDEAEISQPGDESALLALTERLVARRLDRSRPLWRMWFVTGLDDGRVGVVVVLHHALADGLTAMRMIRSLLEPPLSAAREPGRTDAVVMRPPAWTDLALDNLRSMIASALWLAHPATWRLAAEVGRAAWRVSSLARDSPPTSLNAPVGPRRRLATLALDLVTIKRVARAHGCGANDVVLSLVAGGVRELLRARGEPIGRLRPRVGVPVALFSSGPGREAGNDIGTLHIPLPLAEPDPLARLALIAAERARARQSRLVVAEPVIRAWFGRIGWFRRSLDRQRLVNLAETYLPGPSRPIDVLGARVLDLLPIAPLAGNLGLSFVALSYTGRLTIAARVDADQFPDLEVLMSAMERDWQALAGSSGGRSARPTRPDRDEVEGRS